MNFHRNQPWPTVRLGDCVDIRSGESPSVVILNSEGKLYLKVDDLNQSSKYISRSKLKVRIEHAIRPNSLIFPKRGASILQNKIRIVVREFYMDTNLMSLSPDESIDAEYLFYQLGYIGLDHVADTTSIPQINNKHIIPFVVPVPKLKEQKAIAKALSDTDALIAALEKLMEKKRAIKTATMQQLLTGKTRLPGFGEGKGYKDSELGLIPEDWKVIELGKLCRLVNGRGFKPHEWARSGLPIIRIQNLNGSDDFNYYSGPFDKKIFIRKGGLLFAWSGSRGTSFGPHVWRGRDAVLNYHTWKVDVREEVVEKVFLQYALKQLTTQIEDSAHGASALVHVQKWEMEKYEISIPSALQEQQAISDLLSQLDLQITSIEKLKEKYLLIKSTMMQQLLTGRTRLL